jgi:hypothetical protein
MRKNERCEEEGGRRNATILHNFVMEPKHVLGITYQGHTWKRLCGVCFRTEMYSELKRAV